MGTDPAEPCASGLLRAQPAFSDSCPQYTTGWSTPEATVTCIFEHAGLSTPSELLTVLEDPLKVYVVRFFDEHSNSQNTHFVWNDIVKEVAKDQDFRDMGTFQIDCEAEPKFCDEYKITTRPEILAFNNNRFAKRSVHPRIIIHF